MDFVDEVSAAILPGTAAVIADVDESWVTPVDTRLGALGGMTFRHLPGEIVDDELARETDAARAELDQLRTELRESSDQAKANVQKAFDAQRRKLEAIVDRIDLKVAQEQREYAARLATLREQETNAREAERRRIDASMADLQASHDARSAKLAESRRLAKESLEATREALVP
jgi:molecular chaperone DnaK (HSP70)